MADEIKEVIDAYKSLSVRIEILEQQAGKTMLLIGDVATMTGLSKSHIYKLTCTNQIPHYKPNGKHVYFERDEIVAWMKRGRVQTNEEAAQMATMYNVRKSLSV